MSGSRVKGKCHCSRFVSDFSKVSKVWKLVRIIVIIFVIKKKSLTILKFLIIHNILDQGGYLYSYPSGLNFHFFSISN